MKSLILIEITQSLNSISAYYAIVYIDQFQYSDETALNYIYLYYIQGVEVSKG